MAKCFRNQKSSLSGIFLSNISNFAEIYSLKSRMFLLFIDSLNQESPVFLFKIIVEWAESTNPVLCNKWPHLVENKNVIPLQIFRLQLQFSIDFTFKVRYCMNFYFNWHSNHESSKLEQSNSLNKQD